MLSSLRRVFLNRNTIRIVLIGSPVVSGGHHVVFLLLLMNVINYVNYLCIPKVNLTRP